MQKNTPGTGGPPELPSLPALDVESQLVPWTAGIKPGSDAGDVIKALSLHQGEIDKTLNGGGMRQFLDQTRQNLGMSEEQFDDYLNKALMQRMVKAGGATGTPYEFEGFKTDPIGWGGAKLTGPGGDLLGSCNPYGLSNIGNLGSAVPGPSLLLQGIKDMVSGEPTAARLTRDELPYLAKAIRARKKKP